jgi:hypothetical protein
MPAALLQFDEPSHTYRVGGATVPGVTAALAALEDFSDVSPPVLQAAQRFGHHVHKACALLVRGQLDWDRLDPALVPYIRGADRFLKESGIIVVGSEVAVYHPLHRYAGTLDLAGIWRERLGIFDFKSGEIPRTVGPQLAAYEAAYIHDKPKSRPTRRYVIALRPNDYRVKLLTDPNDYSMFLSALNCFKFRSLARGIEV